MMQKFYVIISLVILLAVTIFAFINKAPVTINFFGIREWKTDVPILILACFISGVTLMALIDLVRQIRTWKQMKELKILLKSSEEERKLLRRRVDELEKASSPAAEEGK